jgi:hypothetical protein
MCCAHAETRLIAVSHFFFFVFSLNDRLDFSWNNLTSVDSIDAFRDELTSLVLDNNALPSTVQLPALPHLATLWVNNNNIADLDLFLTHIRARCPALTYLSMLKNAACPNFFTGKPSEDYRRYRHHVLSFFPNLRFLDASPVTDAERAAANPQLSPAPNSRHHLANSAPHLNSSASPKSRAAVAIGSSPADTLVGRSGATAANSDSDSDGEAEHFEIAPEKGLDRMPQRNQNDLHAAFGVSTYTYVGKASEGNRFISNNEL